MNAPFPASDFDATTESSRSSEAFAWIDSDESPRVTDATVHEVLPQVAAQLRDQFNLPLSETVELLSFIAVDCETPPTSAEIEQIAVAAYSADREASAAPEPSTKLEWALDHAANGLPVFPVEPDAKKPAIAGWECAATTDRARTITRWTENPDYNIGTPCSKLLVVDIDPRNGGSPDALRAAGLLPNTWVSRTQGGGWHYIYDLPEGVRVRNSTGKLGPGIDIKSGGGLILLPGSTISGREYRWEQGYRPHDRKRAVAPAGLIEAAKARRERSSAAGERLVEEDAWAVERATKYLRDEAPEATEGNRNNTAVVVINRFLDFGVWEETAHEMALEWNETKCSPPLDPDEIKRIAESVPRSRLRPIGVDHPKNASGFEAVEIDESRKPCFRENGRAEEKARYPKGKFYSISAAECARRATDYPQEWLIENVLHCSAEGVIVGGPGKGKTFTLIDIGLRVASGERWAGNPTLQGGVVYIAAED